LSLAVILLPGQLLRVIRSAGPFAVIVARRLRFLGWFVLAGSLIVVIGQSVAQSSFVSTVVTGAVPAVRNAAEAGLAVIFVALLIACGLLTPARVIRVGAQMSDDPGHGVMAADETGPEHAMVTAALARSLGLRRLLADGDPW
jgi:hypothetical protein